MATRISDKVPDLGATLVEDGESPFYEEDSTIQQRKLETPEEKKLLDGSSDSDTINMIAASHQEVAEPNTIVPLDNNGQYGLGVTKYPAMLAMMAEN